MFFDDDFVESINETPVLGVTELCRRVLDTLEMNREWNDEDIANVTEAFALLRAIEEAGIISFDRYVPEINGDRNTDATEMLKYIKVIQEATAAEAKMINLERMKSRFSNALKSGFTYEFSTGDLERIQTLIAELRDQISTSSLFEDSHQRRLLMRLEKLQAELHKRMSDIDKFWGLIGDAGVALGKFGKDAKPLVDRIREITGIVWNAQSRAEELPSNTQFPSLPSPSSKAEEN
jgi:hypothetical protein